MSTGRLLYFRKHTAATAWQKRREPGPWILKSIWLLLARKEQPSGRNQASGWFQSQSKTIAMEVNHLAPKAVGILNSLLINCITNVLFDRLIID